MCEHSPCHNPASIVTSRQPWAPLSANKFIKRRLMPGLPYRHVTKDFHPSRDKSPPQEHVLFRYYGFSALFANKRFIVLLLWESAKFSHLERPVNVADAFSSERLIWNPSLPYLDIMSHVVMHFVWSYSGVKHIKIAWPWTAILFSLSFSFHVYSFLSFLKIR